MDGKRKSIVVASAGDCSRCLSVSFLHTTLVTGDLPSFVAHRVVKLIALSASAPLSFPWCLPCSSCSEKVYCPHTGERTDLQVHTM
jgi:hypothetical protein